MRLVTLAVALIVAACSGGLARPTPAPSTLPYMELKYRVIDEIGRPWFCDPDFYPVARADEREIAQQRFPEVQKDPVMFSTLLAHLKIPTSASYTADQQLAIYREWKTLNALQLQPVGEALGFTYLAQKSGGSGERVDGRVSWQGSVTVLSRSQSGPPPCPICLALGTRIATPSGDLAVEGLRVGDLVWTTSEHGERVAAPLTAVGSTPVPTTHEIIRLAFDDGRVVFVSPGHPTADGRRVVDLVVGDVLNDARVTTTERVPYLGGATYDILPAGATGAYWANGVLLGSTLRTD